MKEIRWAESDLSILETRPVTPSLVLARKTSVNRLDRTRTRTRTASSSSRLGATTSATPVSNHDGLSTGVKAGVGVSVGGLLSLLFAGLAFFMILRYREKRRNRQDGNDPTVTQQPLLRQPPTQQYTQALGPGQQGQTVQGSAQPLPTTPGGTVGNESINAHNDGPTSGAGSQPMHTPHSAVPSGQPVPTASGSSFNT